MQELKDKTNVRITTTGHSLGGSLATMCAYDLGQVALEASQSGGKPGKVRGPFSKYEWA